MNNVDRTRHAAEEHASDMLETVKDRLNKFTQSARRQSEKLMDSALDQGSELIDDAQKKGASAWRSARGWVRQNPGAALGWAFAAGLIVATWMHRETD